MNPHKWLVLFLVYSDVNYEDSKGNIIVLNKNEQSIDPEVNGLLLKYKQNNFKAIVESVLGGVKHCDEVTILVANNIEGNKNPVIKPVTTVTKLTADGKLENIFNADETDKKTEQEVSELSFSKGEDLQKLFFVINDKFPSKHRLLFTYGHGSAFGIFKDTIDTKLTEQEKIEFVKFYDKELKWQKDNAEFDENYKLMEYGEMWPQLINPNAFIPFRILANEDLAQAILTSFGLVDILVMDNCCMQNVYAQYALRNAVTHFIAPMSGIVLTSSTMIGYNIDYFINECLIKYKGDISSEKLSREIINGFNVLKENEQKDEFKYFVITSINLPKLFEELFEDVKEAMYEIGFLMENNIRFKTFIKDALDDCYGYESKTGTGKTMIDFLELIFQITQRLNYYKTNKFQYDPLNTGRLRSKIEKFKSDYKNFSLFTGSEVSKEYKNGELLSGLCVYFPRTKKEINFCFQPFIANKEYLSSFDIITGWKKNLEYYFDNLSGEPKYK